jgi:predicted dehydrogenase
MATSYNEATLRVDTMNFATLSPAKVGPVRAGVVGAGLMGRWHAHAINKAGGRLVGIADLNERTAERLASRYSPSRPYESVEALIGGGELEVLHVCSPLDTHKRVAELALEAGVHLIIEKPLTQTAPDAEALFNRAADRGLLVCPVHQFVFQDGVAEAARLLPTIGRVVDVSATLVSAGGEGLIVEQQNQLVVDILPHPLSLMRFLLPANYSELHWSAFCPASGELRATGTAEALTISIFISLNARPPANVMKISGTEGTIHLNLFHGYALVESGAATRLRKATRPFEYSIKNLSAAAVNLSRRAVRQEPAYPGLQQLVNSFYRAVRGVGPTPISAQDALAVAQTRDLLIAMSATEGAHAI